jgi:hypothetical protein
MSTTIFATVVKYFCHYCNNVNTSSSLGFLFFLHSVADGRFGATLLTGMNSIQNRRGGNILLSPSLFLSLSLFYQQFEMQKFRMVTYDSDLAAYVLATTET